MHSARRRHRLEAVRSDELAAALADSIGTVVELLERALDLLQRGSQLVDEHVGFAAFGGHLARVGEVRVVVKTSLALASEAELAQLVRRAALLGEQLCAKVRS